VNLINPLKCQVWKTSSESGTTSEWNRKVIRNGEARRWRGALWYKVTLDFGLNTQRKFETICKKQSNPRYLTYLTSKKQRMMLWKVLYIFKNWKRLKKSENICILLHNCSFVERCIRTLHQTLRVKWKSINATFRVG